MVNETTVSLRLLVKVGYRCFTPVREELVTYIQTF